MAKVLDEANLRLVGKIKDAHSLKGEVYVIIFSKDASWSPKLREIFIKKNETDKIEKAIEVVNVKKHKDGVILKLAGINNRNESEALKSYLIYIHEEILTSKPGEDIYLNEIEGFEVFNFEEFVGEIVSFRNYGAHDNLIVENKEQNKTYEIPFVEEFLVDIDFDGEQIFMELPEGLLSINDKD